MKQKFRSVDGFFIRSHLDPDFAILHVSGLNSFHKKYYIPVGEIWIDKQFKPEAKFFWQLEKMGEEKKYKHLPYKKFREILKKKFVKSGPIPNFIHSLEKRGSLKIVSVDGQVVRQCLDPEFVFGGHEYVYDYIPHNEIWLDARQDQRELPYTLIHEMVEYQRMKKGLTYDQAHDIATAYDKAQRRADGIGSYPADANYDLKKHGVKGVKKV